jgi:hypothetical protein
MFPGRISAEFCAGGMGWNGCVAALACANKATHNAAAEKTFFIGIPDEV